MAYSSLTLTSNEPTTLNTPIYLQSKDVLLGTYYASFVSGLDIIPVAASLDTNGFVIAVVPEIILGQSYVFLTKDNSGNLTNSNIIAPEFFLTLCLSRLN